AHFEQVQPLPENSFRVFLHEVNEFDAPWHYHPEFELTLILASEGIRYVGNSVENFGEDDLVLIGANLPHCWKNTESTVRAQAIVIQWQAQFLGEGWMEKPEFNPIRRLLAQAGHGIRFNRKTARRAREMMFRLLQERPFQKLLQLLEILDFLAGNSEIRLLCEHGTAYPLNLEDNQRINTVYNFVRENYREKITLREVAGLVHMNDEAFSRFFSKTMRKPFFAFLNEYRITMARKLLMETDMQVARIGFSCGYDSLPFFYRQFTRYAGMPPQAYRKLFSSAEFVQ